MSGGNNPSTPARPQSSSRRSSSDNSAYLEAIVNDPTSYAGRHTFGGKVPQRRFAFQVGLESFLRSRRTLSRDSKFSAEQEKAFRNAAISAYDSANHTARVAWEQNNGDFAAEYKRRESNSRKALERRRARSPAVYGSQPESQQVAQAQGVPASGATSRRSRIWKGVAGMFGKKT